jgi:hypothetical protein
MYSPHAAPDVQRIVGEQHLPAVKAGFAPDDPVVVVALLRVRSDLASLRAVHGRTAQLAIRSADSIISAVLEHHNLLEDR